MGYKWWKLCYLRLKLEQERNRYLDADYGNKIINKIIYLLLISFAGPFIVGFSHKHCWHSGSPAKLNTIGAGNNWGWLYVQHN
ncbi:uncharacterized protein PRCAT00006368001 [Priceomyces carsonii]|uniref:uncharacterized protein n=1 Tax=Priceomyces carsonii TaxID=28549 RepID=UPI002EDA0D8F|nr:unnamed protein product [Priceomyces carsonii]